MKLLFNLPDLRNTLELLQSALQDKGTANATSNLAVFEFITGVQDAVWLRGFNSYIRVKTKLGCKIERSEDALTLFALDYTKLYMILQTFNKITNADGSEIFVELLLDEESGVVTITIDHTYEVNIGDETKVYTSRICKKYPAHTHLASAQLESLAIIEEGETKTLDITPMLNYIEWFSKLVNVPESYDPRVGKLAFSADKVYTASNLITAVAPNNVSSVFAGMSFTYAALQLIKRVCTQQAEAGQEKMSVIVSPETTTLTLKLHDTEFSIFYFDKVIDYKDFFSAYKKQRSFSIPKSLLLNTLKRCSFEQDNVILHYKDHALTLTANDFVQTLPTYNSNAEEFMVLVTIDLIHKAILGNSTEGILEIYVDVQEENRVFLVLTDGSNTWETVLVLNQRQMG